MKKSFTLKSSKSKPLNGTIHIPPDKSISIRSLIISSICIGNTKIFNLLESDDVIDTLNVLKSLKIKIEKKKSYYEVFGQGGFFSDPIAPLDFGNSGTGARLMTGLLSTSEINATLVGDESLSSRPMLRIIKPLEKMNIDLSHEKGLLPIKVEKTNKKYFPTKHLLEIGSAQVKSAILFAALNIKGTTSIVEKVPSRDHTEIMLKYLGAKLKKEQDLISLTSPNFLKPKDLCIPGDFSSAAFIIVAVLLSKKSKVIIKDVGLNFYRIGLLDVLLNMSSKIQILNTRKVNDEVIGDIEVESSELTAVNVNKSLSPRLIDEYPILFVAASYASGVSNFYGLDELKIKESNRLKTMSTALSTNGVELKLGEDSIHITGNKYQEGGKEVFTENDHRIAMSMLVFGFFSNKSIIIDNMNMIKTSFPGFREIFDKLGAKIEYFQKY